MLMSSNDATKLTLGHAASWLSSACAPRVRSPAMIGNTPFETLEWQFEEVCFLLSSS